MDWGSLNAIGITLMAALGIWALQRAHNRAERDAAHRKEEHK